MSHYIAYDDPSFDGPWNVANNCSTWWSPEELYAYDNMRRNIITCGWDFLYTNRLSAITDRETQHDFK